MTKRSKTSVAAESPAEQAAEVVTAFKGFKADLTCRGYPFEIGGSYKHDGPVEACESGFHACEHPLAVLRYYPPATSRYAEVELRGPLSRQGDDTKIAAAEITIKAELRLPELIASAVKWVLDRAKWSEGPVATGPNEAATASGYQGAATASGRWGAATASGRLGAATASGYAGKARGADGCALFLVERDGDYKIVAVWAGIVGRDGVKPDTYYRLKGGKPVEVE